METMWWISIMSCNTNLYWMSPFGHQIQTLNLIKFIKRIYIIIILDCYGLE